METEYRLSGRLSVGYNCVVLVKQVPDTKRVTGQAMNEDGTVNRAALPAIFNPEDLNALELALQIKEQYGGKITVITMGLPSAAEILRQSLRQFRPPFGALGLRQLLYLRGFGVALTK